MQTALGGGGGGGLGGVHLLLSFFMLHGEMEASNFELVFFDVSW